jgi:hypothetical protein
MGNSDFCAYLGAAQQVARGALPARVLDSLGRDRDDYASQLLLDSQRIRQRFRSSYGYCEPAERRYVRRAMVNRVRNWRRDEGRAGWMVERVEELPDLEYDGTGRVEAREVLSLLSRSLSDYEIDILLRLVQNDGSPVAAFVPERDQCGRRGFCKRVMRIREKLKKFQGEVPGDRVSGVISN